jgi:7-cyano-7-deazaguanine synthase
MKSSESTSPIAVVLLSGGLDSATCLAIAHQQGYRLAALSFDYGQRHQRELDSVALLKQAYPIFRHETMRIDLRAFGASSLTSEIQVPKDREEISSDIPNTYVPARNTIFLSFAMAFAEVLQTPHVFIGVNALDYSGYPDCRPEFIDAFSNMARLATKQGVQDGVGLQIHTPLIHLSKADIIRLGHSLGLDYGMTWSCYDPAASGRPCGHCDSCRLRAKGFAEAGLDDPLLVNS